MTLRLPHHKVAILLSFVATVFCHAFAYAGADEKGLLWKIERDGTRASYLLGTMHSEDERVMKLAPEVQRVFDASSSFTMEVVLDMQSMVESARAMVYTDGRELRKVLGEPLYNKIVPLAAARGLPDGVLNSIKPWAVFLTLSMPQSKTGVFLDAALYNAASEQNKTIHGLETVQEQLGIFEKMSTDEQVQLVAETVKHYDELDKSFEEMIAMYLKRDLAGLQAVNAKYMAIDDPKLGDKLMDELIDMRNRRMVERMGPQLKEGNAFVAVGALHLPGERGILQLLQQQGFRVTAVY